MALAVSTKRLSSGIYIDLASFKASDVNIKDISRSLNYIYRFTGHWKDQEPLTVAQHTKLVAHLADMIFPGDPILKFDCVCHDFSEAYLGDVSTPLKHLFGPAFKEFEHKIENIVYDALWTPVTGIELTESIYQQRKVCDLLSLDIERRSIWKSQIGKDKWPNIPMDTILTSKEKAALFTWAKEGDVVDIEQLYEDVSKEVKNQIEFN